MSFKSWFIVLASLLWSTDTLLRLPLVHEVSAVSIVFLEHAGSAVLALPFLWVYRVELKTLTSKQWAGLVFIGVAASALATVAFTASFNYVNPSVSILLQKVQPLFTFVLAWGLLKEKLPVYFWRWAILALAGGYLVSFPRVLPGWDWQDFSLLGVLLALASAGLWGSATVIGRYLVKDVPYTLVAAVRFWVATPVLLVWLWWNQGVGYWPLLSFKGWWFILLIILIEGFGAMYLYYRGLKETKASISALLELTWPVLAVFLNWIFLGQVLLWPQIVGGLVLLAAISRLTVWPVREQSNQPSE